MGLWVFRMVQQCASLLAFLFPHLTRSFHVFHLSPPQAPADDPGCSSVKRIFNYYKKHGIKTIVMGASFRNKGELLELAGVDRLTIAPKFLAALEAAHGDVPAKLSVAAAKAAAGDDATVKLTEAQFRLKMAQVGGQRGGIRPMALHSSSSSQLSTLRSSSSSRRKPRGRTRWPRRSSPRAYASLRSTLSSSRTSSRR